VENDERNDARPPTEGETSLIPPAPSGTDPDGVGAPGEAGPGEPQDPAESQDGPQDAEQAPADPAGPNASQPEAQDDAAEPDDAQEPAPAQDASAAADEPQGEAETGDDAADADEAAEEDTDADASEDAAGAEDEDGDEETWLYLTTPLDESRRKFFVRELEGLEQISGLFHYKMILRSEDNAVDFASLLGEKVTVVMDRYDGGQRYINGVVSRFVQAGYDGKVTSYYAEVSPWLWLLSLTSDSKIFQNQTVPEILAAVFTAHGFTDFDDRTSATYGPREFCVQYQETAFHFVSRLMEAEGIFYFFEHADGLHTLVMADDADAHPTCPGLERARLRHYLQERQAPDALIDRCNYEQQLIPHQYDVEDFNFETPDTDLKVSVDGKEAGDLKIYEYPGGFTSLSQAEAIADRRIESVELPQKQLRGESFCRAFTAGHRFTLEGHERADMNADYVIRSLSLWVDQERYRNAFEAFPADTAFRPPRITPRPKILGTQTAVVVGKSGEEIWTDPYGRIKVQFHWDRDGGWDENSSCWVRVAQVWAGKNWGTLFIPRIGTEVVVSFLDGDPDRPMVIGTVYNATQTVPYPLPGDKNKSTIQTRSAKQGSAGNEIRFDDTKDSEEFYIHAQKDLTTLVENDHSLTVVKNRTVTVKEEKDVLTVEKGDREVTIKTGNETHKNKGDFTQEVSGDFVLEVKGNLTIKATGEVVIKGAMVKIN